MQEKRDTERMPVLGELQGEMMVFQPMAIREISRAGVTIETRYPLQLESLHDLRLILGNTSVVLKGRVIHSHISDVDQDIVTYRTGIEYVQPSEHVQRAIETYLDAVRTDRSGV